jgi:hypothetical protein
MDVDSRPSDEATTVHGCGKGRHEWVYMHVFRSYISASNSQLGGKLNVVFSKLLTSKYTDREIDVN